MKEAPAAEWVLLSDLVPWDRNPRENEAASAVVAGSLVRFGFGAPIVARREGREVIAGHTRLAAVQLLPAMWAAASEDDRAVWSADAVRLATDPMPRVPVRLLDLDENEAHALALADNRLGELAGWSDDLGDVLRGLGEEGVSLDGLGWANSAITAMLDPVGVDDVKWKEFDETIKNDAPKGKTVKCPHCGESFEL